MPDLQPGHLVILASIPPSLLRGLPHDDQAAIQEAVGKPVMLAGFSYGQAEVEFRDRHGDDHTIWVDASRLIPAE